jgi:dihydroorotate dehydrogenase (fumarate)
MANLKTEYMGLELSSPLVASASPLSRDISNIRRLQDVGAGAVVMFSLFEEQCVPSRPVAGRGPWSALSDESYSIEPSEFFMKPDRYVDHVHAAADAVDIPIIASLNGAHNDRWIQHATLLEKAGAKGIELDLYSIPCDPMVTGTEVEDRYVELVSAVREATSLPLAVKLCPFFTALPAFVSRLEEAGAEALVLFNRLQQPLLDPVAKKMVMSPSLSHSGDSRLAVQWLGILHGQTSADLAANGGFHTLEDVLAGLMAGAGIVELCSALIEHGVDYTETLHSQLDGWLDANGYENVADIVGEMSVSSCGNAENFKRAGYARVLTRHW